MFKNLFDFSLKRNFNQALGFYIAYFVMGMLISGILSGVIGHVMFAYGYPGIDTFQGGYKLGLRIGAISALIFCSFLSVVMLKQKGLFNNFKAVLLALTSVFLSMVGSALFGLIPVAILSTMKSGSED